MGIVTPKKIPHTSSISGMCIPRIFVRIILVKEVTSTWMT